jgi:predicted RNA-binding protein with RPS1 domain
MTPDQADRYSLVELEVTGHQPFGVLVKTDDGARGFVDQADISDVPIGRDDWPAVGHRATGVVLGVTRQGKLRASLRPADVGLVKGVDDAQSAFTEWARIRDQGFADDAEKNDFFTAPETPAILRWALSQHELSSDRDRAEEIVSEAPERLRAELGVSGGQMSPVDDQAVREILEDLASDDPRERVIMLEVLSDRPTGSPDVRARVEELLADDAVTVLFLPYAYGEVRYIAARALAAERSAAGIAEPVVLADVPEPLDTDDLDKLSDRSGLGSMRLLPAYAELRRRGQIPLTTVRLDPAR